MWWSQCSRAAVNGSGEYNARRRQRSREPEDALGEGGILANGLATSLHVPLRICLVYDCLFPHTIGGAECWYRNLAVRLATEGHEVTYLTLRQWNSDVDPDFDGVHVVAVGPRMELYAGTRRRILPPLAFGAGVLAHLLRHGRRYDVVHTASFPYFSLLAAGLARRWGRYRLIVDWHEVWTRDYWHRYVGRFAGEVGWRIQGLCLRIPHTAFCFARLHAARIRDGGGPARVTVLEGEYEGPLTEPAPGSGEPVVVFAGRHIPEKRVPSLVRAFAEIAAAAPELRCEIYGDGPERPAVLAAIAASGVGERIAAPGFVDPGTVEKALASALCLVNPSEREGYGLVVVEAAARGTPSVVVAGPDNAAVELIAPGVNGLVAPSAAPGDLGAAILAIRDGGPALRQRTAAWFAANARRLSLESSLAAVAAAYAGPAAGGPRGPAR